MFTIAPAAPEDWTAALERALAQTPEAERPVRVAQCRHLLANGVLDPSGVWVARTDGAIVAAQVCAPLAGAACLFWLPASHGDVAEALVQAGLDWCRGWHCKLAQALAIDAELPLAEPLLRGGFRPITRLCQLERRLDDLPAAGSALRFEAYRPSLAVDFAATLEHTYEGTLDCPELNGRRSIDEILAGHRGQGRFDPHFWWLAYAGDRPAGVVLLAEMPDGVTWELAYLGIVPEFRRHGFGRAMTLHALHALRHSAARMTLVVDVRNLPACRLYEALGFREFDVSTVLLFFF